ALAFDATRGRTVLTGGLTTTSDTWEYDGTNWFRVATAAAVPARYGHALAYDFSRGRTVLFGGVLINFGSTIPTFLGDTWQYDGNWHEVDAVPPARAAPALAYDSGRGRSVLFGGVDVNRVCLADTWEYDGGPTWVRVVTSVAPRARARHALAYDSR